jgi:hypothetical protein
MQPTRAFFFWEVIAGKVFRKESCPTQKRKSADIYLILQPN